MISRLTPPFVWPETSDPKEAPQRLPYWTSIPDPNQDVSMVGIVWGLDSRGVQFLREMLESEFPRLKVRLVIAVYAASPTTCEVLREMLALAESAQGRLEVALRAISLKSNASSLSALCFSEGQTARSHLWVGNSGNFGFGAISEGHLNFGFEADAAMVARWLNWFVGAWTPSAPLTPHTANIPALVPASGTKEAADSWREYEELFRQLGAPEKMNADPTRPEQVEAQRKAEEEKRHEAVAELCKEMGIRPPDKLQEQIARLMAQGQVVTVDKNTRTPPLELPIRAEWLDYEGSRTVGMISRETHYRIKIFDEQRSKELESKRNGVSELIKRLTFPLADGIRWIPIAAQPLFEHERDRIEKEAREMVLGLIGNSAGDFAKSRRTDIEHDATVMYQEVHPEAERLPQATLNLILRELEVRLVKATEGDFLPKVTYMGAQFSSRPESAHVAEWAQGRTLLSAMAGYFRRAVTKSEHLRGHQIPEEELLKAMDVCKDWILGQRHDRKIRQIAKRELFNLEEILEDESDDRAKCERILAIIEHKPQEQASNSERTVSLF